MLILRITGVSVTSKVKTKSNGIQGQGWQSA